MHKCGSSAIQQALSLHPVLEKESGNGRFVYAAITSDGWLLRGDALRREMAVRAQSYVSSASWRDLAGFGDVRMSLLRTLLGRLVRGNDSVILSNEGWGNQFAVFQRHRLLERMGLRCHVVVYVRPQVAWLNSAWWQWGAWGDMPLQRWANTRRLEWHRVVEGWRNTPGVEKVSVRLLPGDIVTDFARVIGAVTPPHRDEANVSLPGSVLRVLQRHRELRPDPHSSEIEFVLSRHLKMEKGKTPWVLPPELIDRILKQTHDSNISLMECLDDEQKALMQNDPAWWSDEYYADRKLEPCQPQEPNAAELDELVAALFDAMHKLDMRHRQMLAGGWSRPWWRRILRRLLK